MERTTPPFVRRQKNPLTKSFCFPGISLLPSPAIISGTGGVFETYHGMADAPSDVHPILDLPSALRLLEPFCSKLYVLLRRGTGKEKDEFSLQRRFRACSGLLVWPERAFSRDSSEGSASTPASC